jgi:hypothetical protein
VGFFDPPLHATLMASGQFLLQQKVEKGLQRPVLTAGSLECLSYDLPGCRQAKGLAMLAKEV